MEFDIGHFIIFGETNSGKTYYTKYLLDKLNVDNIYVFTKSKHEYEWLDDEYIFDNNFNETAERIIKECEDMQRKINDKSCKNVIIFDDFNEEINTKTNNVYISLYTRGRQCGIRVINLAHQTKAIGTIARTNARYIAIMSNTSESELKNLSHEFYNKNFIKLRRIVKEANDRDIYNVVIIDKRTQETKIDKAEDKIILPIEENIEIVTEIPQGYNPATSNYSGIAPVNNIGVKNANNLYDNSINNFNVNHNIKIKQMIETNNTHNQIKMENITVNYKIKLKEDVLDVKRIIHKPFKTSDDKIKIVHILNQTLRPSIPFNINDYEKGIPIFMKTYFKENYVNKDDLFEKTGNLLMATDPLLKAHAGYQFVRSAFNNKSLLLN